MTTKIAAFCRETGQRLCFRHLRDLPAPRLALFLGSSLGNFEPREGAALMTGLRAGLEPGDALLLGTDLAKDPALLLPAYDDAQGVTAAFNLNLLHRLNRELGADFQVSRFRHVALWNAEASRMEMHLESTRAQTVALRSLDLEVAFEAGERIHTENSYKYTPTMIEAVLHGGGFQLERRWTDPQGWFALHLARVV